jgi:hypothetical protein
MQPPELSSPSLALSPASLPGPELGPDPGPEPGPELGPDGHFPSGPSSPNPEGMGAAQPDPHSRQRIPRWLVRVELFLRVMLRMYIGLAVCYAPWSHTFWDQNPIFLDYPSLAGIAASGAVRGLISGLGLLNLWIALSDAIRHRDE